jgi:hypothetical protein
MMRKQVLVEEIAVVLGADGLQHRAVEAEPSPRHGERRVERVGVAALHLRAHTVDVGFEVVMNLGLGGLANVNNGLPLEQRRLQPISVRHRRTPRSPRRRPPSGDVPTERDFSILSRLPPKTIPSRNSSPIGKTPRICEYSAWPHEYKGALLRINSGGFVKRLWLIGISASAAFWRLIPH